MAAPVPARPAVRRPESVALCLFGAAALALAFLTVPARSAEAAPRISEAVEKGPVGWDTYRTMDGLSQLRPGEQLKQFSSADDTGGNDDGFNGTFSCLRNEPTGRCVIADAHGPGEISSMWFTFAANSVAPIGDITVELDGVPVLTGSLQDIVNGAHGAPFVWPLVGNSADTMGGSVIKVPMPYTRSMKITTRNNPHFYHVDYRQFADANGVRTFNPLDRADDVIRKLRDHGLTDPKPAPSSPAQQHADVNLPPGGRMALPLQGGARQVNQLKLRVPQTVASPNVLDDGRAFGAGPLGPGGSSFNAAVAPNNSGVRIIRRFDPMIAGQRASLSVNGRPSGEWNSGPGVPPGPWGVQQIDVPPDATAGRSQVRVDNRFISSTRDFNEFRYDVLSKVGNEWVRTDVLNVGPNNPHQEAAHGYGINAASWEGLREYRNPDDPRAVAASDEVLDRLRVRITFDGKQTVDAPAGEFFGSGLGKFDVQTLMSTIDAGVNGAMVAWWPMPYARGATVELVNGSGVNIQGGSLDVSTGSNPNAAGGLSPTGPLGYFHATSKRGDTVPGREWNFVNAKGRGVFYGATTSMRGGIPTGGNHQMSFLEGDERGYADGTRSPGVIGTGSEDFYESGWYFMDAEAGNKEGVPYSMPQAGMVGQEHQADGCANTCLGAYRLLLADAAPFGNGLDFEIEHGPDSDLPANYSSTSYWYGKENPSLVGSDDVDAGNDASRAAHGYRADAEARGVLTSTFEGRTDTVPVTGATAANTGPVEFTAKVDPANAGVRLHRTADQHEAFQRANVIVDGQRVGEWYQPQGNQSSRWLEDAFDIPRQATQGKQQVQVRLEPIAGAPPWSGSRYGVLSQVGVEQTGNARPNAD